MGSDKNTVGKWFSCSDLRKADDPVMSKLRPKFVLKTNMAVVRLNEESSAVEDVTDTILPAGCLVQERTYFAETDQVSHGHETVDLHEEPQLHTAVTLRLW